MGVDPHERGGRDARRQPEHAALAGSAGSASPSRARTAGGHRQFDLAEIEALRAAFEETHNVSSAISVARERGAGPASPTPPALGVRALRRGRADRLIEESLTVRSVERTVEEVLLPAVEALATATSAPAPSTASPGAARRAGSAATQRARAAAPARRGRPGLRRQRAPPDLEALHAQALELVLRRAGLRTLTLTARLRPGAPGARDARRSTRARSCSPAARASLDALGPSRLHRPPRRRRARRDPRLPRRDPARGASTVERCPTTPLGGARGAPRPALDGRAAPAARARGIDGVGLERLRRPRRRREGREPSEPRGMIRAR